MKLAFSPGGTQAWGKQMKERTLEGFGARLAALRQRRGLTQVELGEAVQVSNRVIAYYEGDEAQPPGALLVDLARALKVSVDELLGVKPLTAAPAPKTARLLKRLQKVTELPAADQRTVLKLVDALHAARQRERPVHSRPRGSRKAAAAQ